MKTFIGLLLCTALLAGADPAQFQARKAAVRSALQQGDYAGALNQAKLLNREWPDDLEIYQLLSESHLAVGNYDEAEKTVQWMLDLQIGQADSAGWLIVAKFREVIGDIEGAVDATTLAYTRLSPEKEKDRPNIAAYAGRLQYLAGRLPQAEQILAALPDNDLALETLARVRLAQGKPDDAITLLRQLAEKTRSARHLFLLAQRTGAADDFKNFERVALESATTARQANRELVLYFATRGNNRVWALQTARKEAVLRQDVYTLDALAVALHANGQKHEAHAVMRKIVALGTRDPEIVEHANAVLQQ